MTFKIAGSVMTGLQEILISMILSQGIIICGLPLWNVTLSLNFIVRSLSIVTKSTYFCGSTVSGKIK